MTDEQTHEIGKLRSLQQSLDELTTQHTTLTAQYTALAAQYAALLDKYNDMATDPAFASGKKAIVRAINEKGGAATEELTLTQLAKAIQLIEVIREATDVNDYFDLCKPYPDEGVGVDVEVKSEVTDISSRVFNNMPNLRSVVWKAVQTLSGDYCFNTCASLVQVELPNLQTLSGNYCFYNCASLVQVEMPNLQTLSGNYSTFSDSVSLERVLLGKLTTVSHRSLFYKVPNLIDIELGGSYTEGGNTLYYITASQTQLLVYWYPTNVMQDAEKLKTWNKNVREHIAAKLPDRTGQSALTITFNRSINTNSCFETETLQAFVDRNWTVAFG